MHPLLRSSGVFGLIVVVIALAIFGRSLKRAVGMFAPGGAQEVVDDGPPPRDYLAEVQSRMRPGTKLSPVQIRHLEAKTEAERQRGQARPARASEGRANGEPVDTSGLDQATSSLDWITEAMSLGSDALGLQGSEASGAGVPTAVLDQLRQLQSEPQPDRR